MNVEIVDHPASISLTDGAEVELSIVMPCLNEAETLGACIESAQRALDANGIRGEVIIADNGSTDGSREIAARLGARVVVVAERGYGSALMGGIAARTRATSSGMSRVFSKRCAAVPTS
jgi:cellulose synthase/poly-beta-1,6-N-acetylglucosamine synthase-like glycosyltransferase